MVSRRGLELRRILAKNVKKERLNRNLSQEDLAAICDLHRTYIGAIERAERNVTLSTLEAIADGLKLPVQDLLKP